MLFRTLFIPETPAYLKNKDSEKNHEKKISRKFDVLPNAHFIFTIFIYAVCCIVTNFVYFGLIWGAGSLSGSLHMNSAINGFLALVGSILDCYWPIILLASIIHLAPLQKIATSKTIVSFSFFIICFVMGLAWIIPSTTLLSVTSFIGEWMKTWFLCYFLL